MSDPLHPAACEQLVPALRSVAVLVRQRSAPSLDDLHLLVAAMGLKQDWAVQELKIWSEILSSVEAEGDDKQKQSAQRELMLRGVPEAPATLAVELVAKPTPCTTPPGARSVRVSQQSVNFGEMTAGRGARKTLTVTGGPGRVLVGSDMVLVEPKIFGPEDTALTLAVKGGSSGQVLMDEVILERGSESVPVGVCARWSVSSAVASADTGSWTVPNDGSLEDVLNRAKPGDTIWINRGDIQLTHRIFLDKPVRLQGAGIEETRIICGRPGYVLAYAGSGVFAASHLSFQHSGPIWANVVKADRGEVHFWRCRFSGGIEHKKDGTGGNGLYLHGHAHGYVEECEVLANTADGIRVAEQARMVLQRNRCRANRGLGISYLGEATGVVRFNECKQNEGGAILVGDHACPVLEGNDCQENQVSGSGNLEKTTPKPDNQSSGHGQQFSPPEPITLWGLAVSLLCVGVFALASLADTTDAPRGAKELFTIVKRFSIILVLGGNAISLKDLWMTRAFKFWDNAFLGLAAASVLLFIPLLSGLEDLYLYPGCTFVVVTFLVISRQLNKGFWKVFTLGFMLVPVILGLTLLSWEAARDQRTERKTASTSKSFVSVVTPKANIRSKPVKELDCGNCIAAAEIGVELEVIEANQNWYKVKFQINGQSLIQEGWIHKSTVNVINKQL